MSTKAVVLAIVFIFDKSNMIVCDEEVYEGTSFPRKYFLVETEVPTVDNLEAYLVNAKMVINAITAHPNRTDPNRALGVHLMKVTLKRTIMENGKKLNDSQIAKIKELIKCGDEILGYYFYNIAGQSWSSPFRRIIELLRDDTIQTETIGNLNRNRLAKWLVNPNAVNKFARQFDEITLSKESYAKLVHSVFKTKYTISIDISDECLSMIVFNRIYFDKKERPCTADDNCAMILYRSPSVSYSLSHRLLNLLMPRQVRRCYMRSKEADDKLMEALCASMYRETVYLARRGYFFRDMFLEHIALCGLLGYKEFFRLHWFKKLISWVDSDGCIQENMNFEHIRTKISIEKAKTEKKKEKVRQTFRELFHQSCSHHQMSLALVVFAHGIRYAAECIH